MRNTWERILCPERSLISFCHAMFGIIGGCPKDDQKEIRWGTSGGVGQVEKTDRWRAIWGNKNPLLLYSEIHVV